MMTMMMKIVRWRITALRWVSGVLYSVLNMRRVNMIQLASMINGFAVAYINVAVVSIVRCGSGLKGNY